MRGVFDGIVPLQNPNNAGAAFVNAFEGGRERKRQMQTESALSAWAVNPGDEQAFGVLAQADPRLAITLRADQEKRAQAAQVAQLQQAAAAGDPAAKAQLAGIDIDAWAKIDGVTQKKVAEQVDYVGQAALAVKQLPPEQQAAAWDHYVDQGVQMGFTDLTAQRGQYSPQALDGAIANAGLVKDFLGTQEIKWHQEGERPSFATNAMGIPVGAGNPYSATSGTSEPATPQSKADFDALPPGATFKAPDGTIRQKPGGGGGNVTSGFLDGIRSD